MLCRIAHCNKPSQTRGLCVNHYQNWLKQDKPDMEEWVARDGKRIRSCKICSQIFITVNGKKVYCSDACLKLNRYKIHKKWRQENPEKCSQYAKNYYRKWTSDPEKLKKYNQKQREYKKAKGNNPKCSRARRKEKVLTDIVHLQQELEERAEIKIKQCNECGEPIVGRFCLAKYCSKKCGNRKKCRDYQQRRRNKR